MVTTLIQPDLGDLSGLCLNVNYRHTKLILTLNLKVSVHPGIMPTDLGLRECAVDIGMDVVPQVLGA